MGSMGLGVGINFLGLKNPTPSFLPPFVPRAAIMQPNALVPNTLLSSWPCLFANPRLPHARWDHCP